MPGDPTEITGLKSAAAVWDIDGTLLLSGGVAGRAVLDAVQDLTQLRPSPAGIDWIIALAPGYG